MPGITFFDTARFYTDSEEKIGYALSDRRDAFYLATKTAATTAEGFWSDLETSLRNLKTDYIDIYQFHNPAFCPKPETAPGSMRPCWRPDGRARSASSPSPITA